MLPHGSREELSPSIVATSVEGFSGPTFLSNVSSSGWRVGTAYGGGHQQQLWLLRAECPGSHQVPSGARLGALADILAVK